ncbi:hypothetical protein J529_3906 [Acinetobacter baumannii 99063]|jgi:hypothetical protein|uniref:Uncharacterized protein n=1 Tax=Acinetobacter baumannii 99063 TaxID=1310630 RepID=A0A009RWJ4_ACIBA|nr:hypothetical protein J529_3906 [Acinetobacter baumannii 99063]EXT49310.1 hypothetical protein J807_3103 [Acinetobacter sp. 25977_4]
MLNKISETVTYTTLFVATAQGRKLLFLKLDLKNQKFFFLSHRYT